MEAGGNCPLSKLGQIVIHNGVKIIGHANVPGRVAKDASNLYAKNIVNFLSLFIKQDEKKIRSLFGMKKGQLSMREALGMNSETPAKEAIKKFWLLGEFLDLGTGVENEKLSKDLKKRQELLADYKQQISKLKNKLKDDEEDENEKSVE